jgi:GNAT superfamily N-acetyltransferase
MTIHIDHAQPSDAAAITMMVGELLHEIMAAVKEKAFGFHQDETTAHARAWMKDGEYTVLLARDGAPLGPLGFLALYESYALYTEGTFGTIPEFFVRPSHRSKGIGAALLTEAKPVGSTKGWRRLEVTNLLFLSSSVP